MPSLCASVKERLYTFLLPSLCLLWLSTRLFSLPQVLPFIIHSSLITFLREQYGTGQTSSLTGLQPYVSFTTLRLQPYIYNLTFTLHWLIQQCLSAQHMWLPVTPCVPPVYPLCTPCVPPLYPLCTPCVNPLQTLNTISSTFAVSLCAPVRERLYTFLLPSPPPQKKVAPCTHLGLTQTIYIYAVYDHIFGDFPATKYRIYMELASSPPYTYLGLARTVHTHRIRPYVW
jgi:hypothetical protein